MTDLEKLIEELTKKFDSLMRSASASKKSEFKVYTSEPIIRKASNMNTYMPDKYKQMRRFSHEYPYFLNDSKLFIKEAHFMADFEDDYDENVCFNPYYKYYSAMRDHELRSYFSWRTKVRKNVIEKTYPAFVRFYVSELIMNIGVKDKYEGYEKLNDFIKRFSGIPEYVPIFKDVLNDYIIVYSLSDQHFDNKELTDRDDIICSIVSCEKETDEKLFDSVCALSGYSSKCFDNNKEDALIIVKRIITQLYKSYGKTAFSSRFVGTFRKRRWYPFQGTLTSFDNTFPDSEIEINSVRSYFCQSGIWYKKDYQKNNGKYRELYYVLKEADRLLREKVNFRSKLKEYPIPENEKEVIENEINEYIFEKEEAKKPKIEIDKSKFDSIRSDSLYTAQKLITEEDNEDVFTYEETKTQSEKEATEALDEKSDDFYSLTETEYGFLKALIDNKDANDYSKSKNAIASVIADSINEKLFELFSDNVIEYTDRYEIIEDYRSELEGMFR